MRIVVTNDDGVEAPGLAILVEVARALGEPIVVAPQICHSQGSHAVTFRRSISIEKRHRPEWGEYFVCQASPADCVRLALRHLPIGPINLVLAGINPGANVGQYVWYSGTVAAAREAALLGVAGIAVSQLIRPDWSDKWNHSRSLSLAGLQHLLPEIKSSATTFLDGAPLFNLNLPALPAGEQQGIKRCPLSTRATPTLFEPPPASLPASYTTQFCGNYFENIRSPGSDFDLLMNGWITLTPLRLDQTDHSSLDQNPTGADADEKG
ncbi:MAG: 5'-nucleotidase SurE [Phycisphaerae bacterium]|nr:5'-nucleotidase SurE [Phycisphaerae bacterium]